MTNNKAEVQKIKEYLRGRIAILQKKVQEFESPILQEMCKNSPHLQFDYIKVTTALQELQDTLLAIEKFVPDEQGEAPAFKNENRNNGTGRRQKAGDKDQ